MHQNSVLYSMMYRIVTILHCIACHNVLYSMPSRTVSSQVFTPHHIHLGNGVFSAKHFYLSEGVAGVNAPSWDEIKSIVESGGGTWMQGSGELLDLLESKRAVGVDSLTVPLAAPSSSSSASSVKSSKVAGKKRGAKEMECTAEEREGGSRNSDVTADVVILSSEAAYPSAGKEVHSAVRSALQCGHLMGGGVYPLEVLFLAVIRQELLFDVSSMLKSSTPTGPHEESPPPPEDKKKPTAKSRRIR